MNYLSKEIIIYLIWIFFTMGSVNSYSKNPECHIGDCPSGLGQVQSQNSVCTGFLISEKEVATNQHCIPDSVKKGSSCQNIIKMNFIKNDQLEEEIIGCKKLVNISGPLNNKNLGPDIAVFELEKKSLRTPLTVNPTGLKDKDYVTIYKINPNKSKDESAVVEKILCPAIQNSIINLQFNQNNSSVFTFYPCQMESGNSGSPALNNKGEVVAIMNAISDTSYLKQTYSYLKSIPENISHGTNSKCLKQPSLCHEEFNNTSESQLLNEMNRSNNEILRKNVKSEVFQEIEKLHEESEKFLQWNIDTLNATEIQFKETGLVASFTLIPHCVSYPQKSIDKNKNQFKNRIITKHYNTTLIEAFSKLSPYLKIENELKKSNKKISVDMIPANLIKENFPIKVKFENGSELNINLPFCPLDRVKFVYE